MAEAERTGLEPADGARGAEGFLVFGTPAPVDLVGAIVLRTTEEGFNIDNVAVRPLAKGTGVGRMLLQLAEFEARQRGYDSVYLATHELMTENRALYLRIGYVEYDHRVVNGYPRVFFRKLLAPEVA